MNSISDAILALNRIDQNRKHYKIQETYLDEGTHYDTEAAEMLVRAGIYDEDTARKKIDDLMKHKISSFKGAKSWLQKYIKGVIRILFDEIKSNQVNPEEFLTNSAPVFNSYLEQVKLTRPSMDPKEQQALDLNFNQKMSYQEVVNAVEKIKQDLEKENDEKLKNLKKSENGYEVIPIDSYDDFHSMFGGPATGDGKSDGYSGDGNHGTAWCHTNHKPTYDMYTNDGQKMFFVLAKNNWQNIPFDADTNEENAKDEYGNSLIALLVNPTTGALEKATLRSNHVGNVRGNADNQYRTYGELSELAGFDVQQAVFKELTSRGYNPKEWSKDTFFWNGDDDVPQEVAKVVVEDGVRRIYGNTFYTCTNLKQITLPDTVQEIGRNAFMWCTSLQSIILPSEISLIERYAFCGCDSLQSITFAENNRYLLRLEQGTFQECTSLKTITLPNNITTIPAHAFFGCASLETVVLPENLDVIDNYAFVGCETLKSISIPATVTRIGFQAFAQCNQLKSITLPKKLLLTTKEALLNWLGLATETSEKEEQINLTFVENKESKLLSNAPFPELDDVYSEDIYDDYEGD